MDKPEDKEKIGWLFLMLAFLFVIVAWGATWHLFNDIEERGTFTDPFRYVMDAFR